MDRYVAYLDQKLLDPTVSSHQRTATARQHHPGPLAALSPAAKLMPSGARNSSDIQPPAAKPVRLSATFRDLLAELDVPHWGPKLRDEGFLSMEDVAAWNFPDFRQVFPDLPAQKAMLLLRLARQATQVNAPTHPRTPIDAREHEREDEAVTAAEPADETAAHNSSGSTATPEQQTPADTPKTMRDMHGCSGSKAAAEQAPAAYTPKLGDQFKYASPVSMQPPLVGGEDSDPVAVAENQLRLLDEEELWKLPFNQGRGDRMAIRTLAMPLGLLAPSKHHRFNSNGAAPIGMSICNCSVWAVRRSMKPLETNTFEKRLWYQTIAQLLARKEELATSQ